MSLRDLKEEFKQSEGDPHIKGKLRRMRLERSRKRMMADVESFVKSNPGPALAVATAFGFLLGRALSRD